MTDLRCNKCLGRGYLLTRKGATVDCQRCRGRGEVEKSQRNLPAKFPLVNYNNTGKERQSLDPVLYKS